MINWNAVGAIATTVAAVVALGGYWFLEYQRRAALKIARRSAAHLIGIRTARLLNQVVDLQLFFRKYPQVDWRQSSSLLPPVHPLLGTSHDHFVMLEKDEISLLIEMSEAEYLSEIMLVGSRLNSIVISMNEYARRYDDLYKMLPPPMEMRDAIGAHDLKKEDLLKARPYSIQLHELIDSIRAMVDENVPLMHELAMKYHPMMKRQFPKERFISLSLPQS